MGSVDGMGVIEHWDARALVLLREARAMIPHADVRAYVRNDWCARADQLIESPPTQGAVEALREIAAFEVVEVDPDDGWDYSVGVMRAIAAHALDGIGEQ